MNTTRIRTLHRPASTSNASKAHLFSTLLASDTDQVIHFLSLSLTMDMQIRSGDIDSTL